MMNEYSQQSQDYQLVEQTIRYLEASFRDHPSLEEMAGSVHLSKYHFQRLFKRWAGISPTQFQHFLTVEYAKEQLQKSQSILDVTLDAGLSSPGRLHDLFVTFEAITPGEYKRQGADLRIVYGIHDTPFGQCVLATTPRGICGLHFAQEGDATAAVEQLVSHWPQAALIQDEAETRPFIHRIFAPAAEDPPRPFHLLLKGTNYQVQVWRALLAIPPAVMVSYQEVAAYLGQPGASRAVANAIARNPIAYLIPCHRVISKSGRIHHYRWGTTRKKALLAWEAGQQRNTAGDGAN